MPVARRSDAATRPICVRFARTAGLIRFDRNRSVRIMGDTATWHQIRTILIWTLLIVLALTTITLMVGAAINQACGIPPSERLVRPVHAAPPSSCSQPL